MSLMITTLKNSGLEDEQNELQRVYNKLYVKFIELREDE
jgi:hypothetical protein